MISCSRFIHEYDLPVHRIQLPLSEDYHVWAGDEEIPVYTCRISRYPFNTPWPGHQRPLDQSELCSYINLVGDEEVTLQIRAKKPHSRVLVKPFSRNITATEEDGVISLTLKSTGSYVLELDDYHGLLYIFYSRPIVCEDPASVTHYFGPGIHYPRHIQLKSGDRVYIDKDALVYGNLFARDAKDIEIFGNGILDDSAEERFAFACYEDYAIGNIKFYDCENIRIRGIGMTNSAIWCLNFFHCFDADVEDIKIFGQWRYNTDGIDIVNCQNIQIRRSFVHAFDDAIVIKGIQRHCKTSNKNIHVSDSVIWCDWGKTCEIGIETACLEYDDISFVNCDLLRAGNTACDIANGYTSHVHNIRFEDIRVEYNRFDTREQLQETDEDVYTKQNEISIPSLINVQNYRYEGYGKLYNIRSGDQIGERAYCVSDILCRNLSVYYDDGLPLREGKPLIRIRLCNQRNGAVYENITVENVFCNGKKLDLEDIVWEIENTEMPLFR